MNAVDEEAAMQPLGSWTTQWPRLFLPMRKRPDAETLVDGSSPLLMGYSFGAFPGERSRE
jgi:hypothetical protein